MADQSPAILIAPYLPFTGTVTIGPWQLVAFGRVADEACVPEDLREMVEAVIGIYRLPSSGGAVLGGIAHPIGQQVGARFDRALMPRLQAALLAGAIANNPRMTCAPEDQDANAGHAGATSENALLYGHPLGAANSYAVEIGSLYRVIDARFAGDGESLTPVTPPIELPRPLFCSFDDEVASAAYALMDAGDDFARRLQRALDWYAVALSNSTAVTPDVRVGAARSALEVLLGMEPDAQVSKLVRQYGHLLRTPGTAETTYDEVYWAKGPVRLIPDEWWLTRLSSLRNQITHGDEIPADLWQHDGHHQLDHIHDRLIEALAISIADASRDALLRLPLRDRVFPRIAQQLAEAERGQTPGP